MWFKFSESLLNCDACAELRLNADGKRTKYHTLRQLAFIRLLASCADGCEFSCAESLAARLGAPLQQIERVWSVCLEYGVLSKTDSGRYTAASWMRERGLFGKDETKKKTAEIKKSHTPPPPKTEPLETEETEPTKNRSKDIAALFGGLNFKPNKKD